MAARRCSTDSIDFPNDYRFNTCPVCHEATSYISNLEAQDDWFERVSLAQEHTVSASEEPESIPKVEARVRVCSDGLCVNSDDVYHSSWPRKIFRQGDLFQIGQQVFEVLGHIREPRREYAVRSFSTTLTDEEVVKLVSG